MSLYKPRISIQQNDSPNTENYIAFKNYFKITCLLYTAYRVKLQIKFHYVEPDLTQFSLNIVLPHCTFSTVSQKTRISSTS